MGARHSGGAAEAGLVRWPPRPCLGCSASLGLALPARRGASARSGARVCAGGTRSPAQVTAWAVGARAHVQLRVHVGTCSLYPHARPCARGRLRRDRFATRQPSADRFRSADPSAASGTRAFAEPSPSLPTELTVPRHPRPRAASWPWENRDRGCPSWGRAGAQALDSRVPLWPVLPPKHPFLRLKFQRKGTWRWWWWWGWGWGGGGGRSHLEACSPATLPGWRESLPGTCRGGEAS